MKKSPLHQKEKRIASNLRNVSSALRHVSPTLRYRVLSRDHFRCVFCGVSPANDIYAELQVDHIIPFSKGGETVPDNLQTLCKDCNIGKGAS